MNGVICRLISISTTCVSMLETLEPLLSQELDLPKPRQAMRKELACRVVQDRERDAVGKALRYAREPYGDTAFSLPPLPGALLWNPGRFERVQRGIMRSNAIDRVNARAFRGTWMGSWMVVIILTAPGNTASGVLQLRERLPQVIHCHVAVTLAWPIRFGDDKLTLPSQISVAGNAAINFSRGKSGGIEWGDDAFRNAAMICSHCRRQAGPPHRQRAAARFETDRLAMSIVS